MLARGAILAAPFVNKRVLPQPRRLRSFAHKVLRVLGMRFCAVSAPARVCARLAPSATAGDRDGKADEQDPAQEGEGRSGRGGA